VETGSGGDQPARRPVGLGRGGQHRERCPARPDRRADGDMRRFVPFPVTQGIHDSRLRGYTSTRSSGYCLSATCPSVCKAPSTHVGQPVTVTCWHQAASVSAGREPHISPHRTSLRLARAGRTQSQAPGQATLVARHLAAICRLPRGRGAAPMSGWQAPSACPLGCAGGCPLPPDGVWPTNRIALAAMLAAGPDADAGVPSE
jgi:hypothetical protein